MQPIIRTSAFLVAVAVVAAAGCGGNDYQGTLTAETDASASLRQTATLLRDSLASAIESDDFETERDIMLEGMDGVQLDAGNYPETDAKLVNRVNQVYQQLPTLTKEDARGVIGDLEADLN